MSNRDDRYFSRVRRRTKDESVEHDELVRRYLAEAHAADEAELQGSASEAARHSAALGDVEMRIVELERTEADDLPVHHEADLSGVRVKPWVHKNEGRRAYMKNKMRTARPGEDARADRLRAWAKAARDTNHAIPHRGTAAHKRAVRLAKKIAKEHPEDPNPWRTALRRLQFLVPTREADPVEHERVRKRAEYYINLAKAQKRRS